MTVLQVKPTCWFSHYDEAFINTEADEKRSEYYVDEPVQPVNMKDVEDSHPHSIEASKSIDELAGHLHQVWICVVRRHSPTIVKNTNFISSGL
jgi:hypothetical protein